MTRLLTLAALAAWAMLPAMTSGQMPAGAKKAPPSKRTELFVGGSDLSWLPRTGFLPSAVDLQTRAQTMSSRVRNLDPFGLSTFPKEGDMEAPQSDLSRPSERITLNQALKNLKVTGINLKKKEILMRGQNIFEGDVMMLSFRDEIFFAQITEVGATQIVFRDIKRQETGVLPHSLIPHLNVEPIQQRSGQGGLAGKATAMELLNPRKP